MVVSFRGTIICFTTKAVPLRSIKGFPCTMDVEAFIADLKLLKPDNDEEEDGGTGGDCSGNGTIKLPDYDRTLHDPVPGRIEVGAHHKLVVVEGLHLLHDQGRWSVGLCFL
jgi:pantothenate kinase